MKTYQRFELSINKKDLTGCRREVFLRNSTLFILLRLSKSLINHKILDCFKTPPLPPIVFKGREGVNNH